jgi:hypothetical protein
MPFKSNKPRKTKRTRHHHTVTLKHKPCCEHTFHGLEKWVCHAYEDLGWMVLAKEHGHHERVHEYVSSLKRLRESILHKLTHIHEKDRKDDLHVLLHKVDVLIQHTNKDF